MPKTTKQPPKPFEIDQICEAIHAKLALIEQVETALEAVEKDMLALVKRFGSARAEKSLALVGLKFEAVRTDPTKTTVVDSGVEALRVRMALAQLPRSEFGRLFQKAWRYTIAEGYSTKVLELLKRIDNVRVRKDVADLAQQAVVITPQKPKLQVRQLKPVIVKKSAKKAAAA